MLKVSVSEFPKWANQLSLEVIVDGMKHPVYIIPAQFCATRFLNDARYLNDDSGNANRREPIVRKASTVV